MQINNADFAQNMLHNTKMEYMNLKMHLLLHISKICCTFARRLHNMA